MSATDFGAAFQGLGQTYCPRLRQAYGEWDMTPNWTLLVGQTDQIETLGIIGVTLVDFFGDAGINGGTRFAQARITYHDGPLTWAVAMERPEEASDTLIPGLGSFLQYDIAGGHQLIVAGGIGDINSNPLNDEDDSDHRLGWVVGAGANINLADIATFTAGGQYTEGLATRWMNQLQSTRTVCDDFTFDPSDGSVTCDNFDNSLQKAWGVTAGLTFNVNDTTSINIEGGYAQNVDAADNPLLLVDNVTTVHGNILWQPVKQMRLGWEVMWGRENFVDDKVEIDDADVSVASRNGGHDDDKVCFRVFQDPGDHSCQNGSDALRIQFGAWFFEEEPGAELDAQGIAPVLAAVVARILEYAGADLVVVMAAIAGRDLYVCIVDPDLVVDEVLAAPHDFPAQTHLLDRLPQDVAVDGGDIVDQQEQDCPSASTF